MRSRHPITPDRPSGEPASPPVDVGGGPYRIHAIADMTGVPEPTLRAWERRYGLPTPERTAAGYRLYSARDVEQVRAMQRLCGRGMATAEAARAILATPSESVAATPELDPHAASVDAIVASVVRFDDRELDRQLRRAMFLGPGCSVAERVIGPALERIGGMWHAGLLSVAQEHFASHRLGTTMRDLVRLSIVEDAHVRTVVACFADEDHDVGALAVAIRLATWGTRPVFLGARTPPEAIRSAVEEVSPGLVALSVSLAPAPARARALIDGYARACNGVPWMVGGAAAASLGDRVREAGGLVAPTDMLSIHALVRRAVAAQATARPRALDARRKSP